MVYTPSTYLVTAAVALLVTRMQETAATSMFYDPELISNTTSVMDSHFMARGMELDVSDLQYIVHVDPTMPDITSISAVPVMYPELLAKKSTGPVDPVSTKVGTGVVSIPALDTNCDGYIDAILSKPVTLPGIVPTLPFVDLGHGAANGTDCASGWGEETKSKTKGPEKRRLEAASNSFLAQLEAHFGKPVETKLANLPKEGAKTTCPWPGPYWAMYQDSVNIRWKKKHLSPTEKYAKAFGLDPKTFSDAISAVMGVDSPKNRFQCENTDYCATKFNPDVVCGGRRESQDKICIYFWSGCCHAWSVASILEDEPRCPVKYNGVKFQPLDIKGLLSAFYDGSRVSMITAGVRFRGEADSKDEYGRHSNAAYRDINPATFHIAATNILGIFHKSFVIDKSATADVWNQPIRGYKVYEETEMTLQDAAQTFYGLETYPWNAAAKSIVYIKLRLSWIGESNEDGSLVLDGKCDKYTEGEFYTYLLEMDDEGKIIGGEWVYRSHDIHPDFLWFPKAKPSLDMVTQTGLKYKDLAMLLEKSIACTDA